MSTEPAVCMAEPRSLNHDNCVLRTSLELWAREKPGQVFVHFADGQEWTFRELLDRVRRLAAGLQKLGLRQGDPVLSWLPNGPEALLAFLAVNYAGAVFVPVNTAYKGRMLEQVIENSGAHILFAHPDLISRLDLIHTGAIEVVIVTAPVTALVHGIHATRTFAAVASCPDEPKPLDRPIEPWDTQTVLYTSGTTGPSKGVMNSYRQIFDTASPDTLPFLTQDDRFLITVPLFHVGGVSFVNGMLARGGSIVLSGVFETGNFWPLVRRTGATSVFLLGVMGNFLARQAPSPNDRDNPLRTVVMVPLVADLPGFAARFGVDVFTLFNMTEISTPIVSKANPSAPKSCGTVRAGVAVKVVDRQGRELPPGEVGELIVKADNPWSMNHGYLRSPEATAQAWTDGWFHTGDAFRCDAEGNYYFIDRMKDAIRRRGENISSFEVESEVAAYPGVFEAAAIAVPSEHGEDEVMVVVSPMPGRTIDPQALLAFLIDRMAHFMLPRYIRIVDQLPKTPTAKVMKHLLRDISITSDTWDREEAGIQIKRARLG